MREKDLISMTTVPGSRTSLAEQLQYGGLRPGMTALVHTSMSSLGWIAGGPVSVIHAILDVIGSGGTLVMPSHTSYLTDPAGWSMPAVPDSWIAIIRKEMPVYDPNISPTRNMGAVAELFRAWPRAKRSVHPTCSFSAVGKRSDIILSNHLIGDPLGKTSPLGKLYAEDAQILLLGVDFNVCTMLHLAEQLAWPDRPKNFQQSPIKEDGQRIWKVYEESPLIDSKHFLTIGEKMKKEKLFTEFSIGAGIAMRMSAKVLVDYATNYWKTTGIPDD